MGQDPLIMTVTECLNAEHDVFLLQLCVLERMLEERLSADDVRACALMLAAAVERHRDVEEELLYPEILRRFGQDFPPMRVMEAEHKEIERCVVGLRDRTGNAADLARRFVAVLRDHIQKEMQVLFPMAESRIPAAELRQMAERCAAKRHCAAHGHA